MPRSTNLRIEAMLAPFVAPSARVIPFPAPASRKQTRTERTARDEEMLAKAQDVYDHLIGPVAALADACRKRDHDEVLANMLRLLVTARRRYGLVLQNGAAQL